MKLLQDLEETISSRMEVESPLQDKFHSPKNGFCVANQIVKHVENGALEKKRQQNGVVEEESSTNGSLENGDVTNGEDGEHDSDKEGTEDNAKEEKTLEDVTNTEDKTEKGKVTGDRLEDKVETETEEKQLNGITDAEMKDESAASKPTEISELQSEISLQSENTAEDNGEDATENVSEETKEDAAPSAEDVEAVEAASLQSEVSEEEADSKEVSEDVESKPANSSTEQEDAHESEKTDVMEEQETDKLEQETNETELMDENVIEETDLENGHDSEKIDLEDGDKIENAELNDENETKKAENKEAYEGGKTEEETSEQEDKHEEAEAATAIADLKEADDKPVDSEEKANEASPDELFHMEVDEVDEEVEEVEQVAKEEAKKPVTAMKMVDESIPDEPKSGSIVNEISLEPVDANDTDEEEEEEPEVALAKEPEVATAKDGTKEAKSALTKDIEVTTIDDDDDEPRMTDEVDYDEALKEISKIDENHKKIMEDSDIGSLKMKRPAAGGTEGSSAKKMRTEDGDQVLGTVKKQLRKMPRKQLENMFTEKLVQLMTNKSEVGTLRRQVDSYKESTELWQRRAEALSKQVKDLSTVMRKYIIETKNKVTRNRAGPIRITRSVGLQVIPPEKRNAIARQGIPHGRGRGRPAHPRHLGPQGVQLRAPAPHQPPVSPRQSIPPIPTNNVPRPATNTGLRPIQPAQPKPAVKQPELVELDLSDDEETAPPAAPVQQFNRVNVPPRPQNAQLPVGRAFVPRQMLQKQRPMNPVPILRHPAPLPNPPPQPHNSLLKNIPPKPTLKISKGKEGVVLSWNMVLNVLDHATVSSYQLFAYQETPNQKPDRSLWKKVGDVKALPLPMACTLKQFLAGHKYHFAVRACDTHARQGIFSDPASIQI